MFIVCSNCEFKYLVNSADLKPNGRMVECANCNHQWFQELDDTDITSSVPSTKKEEFDQNLKNLSKLTSTQVYFRGNSITCKGELQIDGRINGNINGEKVILGPESSMDGTLNADEIVISGKFKGKIKGKSIRLDSGAIVDAEITYEILAIEDGSSINGLVKKYRR